VEIGALVVIFCLSWQLSNFSTFSKDLLVTFFVILPCILMMKRELTFNSPVFTSRKLPYERLMVLHCGIYPFTH